MPKGKAIITPKLQDHYYVTYLALFYLCINLIFQTKKFYVTYKAIAKQEVLLDYQLSKKKLSTDQCLLS